MGIGYRRKFIVTSPCTILRSLLSQNSVVMSHDLSVEKFQKLRDMMGLLSKLWKWLEDNERTGAG